MSTPTPPAPASPLPWAMRAEQVAPTSSSLLAAATALADLASMAATAMDRGTLNPKAGGAMGTMLDRAVQDVREAIQAGGPSKADVAEAVRRLKAELEHPAMVKEINRGL